ncbi:MAG: hypothetical protein ACREEL_08365 [Stellaceae bacterium]
MEGIAQTNGSGLAENQPVGEDRGTVATEGLHLDLWVKEQEVVDALSAHSEGRARDEYTRIALRIGILALNQAQGRLDAEVVRREGERLISTLGVNLGNHHRQVESLVAGTLSDYFNPQGGKFNERIERLIKQDGDLERLMRSQVSEHINSFKETLDQYIGERSTFTRLLTPGDSNQLMTAIRNAVDGLVTAQGNHIVAEFSLDKKDGALSRLLAELTQTNGTLTGNLETTVKKIVDEFSLDNEGSALNRLVKRVETAQNQISQEFTLDSEVSALSRLKRDLLAVVDSLRSDNNKFQVDVVSALKAMQARKDESFASTRHGGEFEATAISFIEDASQRAGDISESTGGRTGNIKHCKVGDCVLTLGPDCDQAGARIVFEMKEDASYDLKASLSELATARKNREAVAGVFVHSKRTAPTGLKPLARYGMDIVVIWDAEDAGTDVYFEAAITIAKALALRAKASKSTAIPVDLEAFEKAIREIERQAGFLDEIKTSSGTIKSGADRILIRVEQMRTALANQIATLDQQGMALRQFGGASETALQPSQASEVGNAD